MEGCNREGGKKGQDPGHILEAGQTRFADGLDMEGEGKRGVKSDSKTFGLGNWKDAVYITREGEEGDGVGLRGRSEAQFCVCYTFECL